MIVLPSTQNSILFPESQVFRPDPVQGISALGDPAKRCQLGKHQISGSWERVKTFAETFGGAMLNIVAWEKSLRMVRLVSQGGKW